MTQTIQVTCMVHRTWDTSAMVWSGDWISGTLIDISVQSTENNSGKLHPVGIVLLEDNTFQCIPMEFIKKAAS